MSGARQVNSHRACPTDGNAQPRHSTGLSLQNTPPLHGHYRQLQRLRVRHPDSGTQSPQGSPAGPRPSGASPTRPVTADGKDVGARISPLPAACSRYPVLTEDAGVVSSVWLSGTQRPRISVSTLRRDRPPFLWDRCPKSVIAGCVFSFGKRSLPLRPLVTESVNEPKFLHPERVPFTGVGTFLKVV